MIAPHSFSLYGMARACGDYFWVMAGCDPRAVTRPFTPELDNRSIDTSLVSVEVIVPRPQCDADIGFKQGLSSLVGFFDKPVVHGAYALLGEPECIRKLGNEDFVLAPFALPIGGFVPHNFGGELPREGSLIFFGRWPTMEPIPLGNPVRASYVEMLGTLAEKVDTTLGSSRPAGRYAPKRLHRNQTFK
jgi:hypothetical protein